MVDKSTTNSNLELICVVGVVWGVGVGGLRGGGITSFQSVNYLR